MKTTLLIIATVLPLGTFAQVNWNQSGDNSTSGRVLISGETSTTGFDDISISRSKANAGIQLFNSNVTGRSVILFGQGFGGRYGLVAHHGESHDAGVGLTQTYKPKSTILAGYDLNGLGLISASEIRFTAGGGADEFLRMKISANGDVNISQNLSVNNGATISSHLTDADPNSSWSSNLSVRNNNGGDNTFSRLSFVSAGGGMGAVSVKKVSEFAGDMFFQVRNGPGFFQTPLLIKSNGNVGIGTANPNFKLDVAGSIASSYTYLDNSIDVENGYTRSNFGSNVYWDPVANYWQVRPIGNNDFTSIIHTNGGGLAFITAPTTGNVPRSLTHSEFMANERIRITSSGDVGIGTAYPDTKLAVKGTIHTNEVRVDLLGSVAPDYVFEKGYTLLPLSELAIYINKNKHLPEVPSAQEMEENGVNLKEMNLLLLKKVEELTLHLIESNMKIENQQLQIERLNKKIYEKN